MAKLTPYITTAQAARMKKVHPETVRRWVRLGYLRDVVELHSRMYLLSRAEVRAFRPRPAGRPAA